MVAISTAAPATKTAPAKKTPFRWTYIALPGAILLFSVILAAGCFHRLPSEVAYHFTDGAPDQWLGRGAVVAWTLIPQFALVVIALAITAGTAALSARSQIDETTPVKRVLAIMGNIVAMPQLIIAFAMFDIFLYNIYQIHLIPLWAFAVIVIILGSMMLGIFLVQALRRFRELPDKNPQE
ncbi:hypothetical protein ACFLX3_01860 [Chloroflexota bacterium]